jgi:alpha,alpha-trehalose phosphorylase
MAIRSVVLGFAGVDHRGDMLSLHPRLPPEWRGMSFSAQWQGRSVQVRIAESLLRVAVDEGPPMEFQIAGRVQPAEAGAPLEVSVEPVSIPS